MDLLDSIMKGMDKPPTTNKTDQQMKISTNKCLEKFTKSLWISKFSELKEHQENLVKERDLLTKFRLKIQAKITDFNNNEDKQCLQFPPMQSVFRTIM